MLISYNLNIDNLYIFIMLLLLKKIEEIRLANDILLKL